jgi:YspA, cpYpsA-related SLOG family
MLTVLICGGRNYSDYERILATLVEVGGKEAIKLVVHGSARGADLLGDRAATQLDIPSQGVPADWTTYGKAAGPIRNQFMLDQYKPDLCLAFPDPESRGTWDMVRRAKMVGVETRVIQ